MTCERMAQLAELDDGDFWERVFNGYPTEPDWDGLGSYDEPEPDELEIAEPCGICGVHGACGYDALGRPWIHAVSADEDVG